MNRSRILKCGDAVNGQMEARAREKWLGSRRDRRILLEIKAPVLSAENTDSLRFYTERDFKQNSAPEVQITVTLLYFKVVFVSSLM